MVRRIASQVHQQVSRLMRADYIKKEPIWYKAVLQHPPLPLPPKAPSPRTPFDQDKQTAAKSQAKDPKPTPIYYVEDDIRRQFFRDHPFEAFRPTTLVEGPAIEDLDPIRGSDWTRLRQRGRNPTAEDAIRFALNLYEHHSVPLTQAYSKAVAQFRSLRSEHSNATTFAVLEAQELGAVFSHSEIAHAFEKEKKGLATWERQEHLDEGAIAARKRWKAIVERDTDKRWTKGKAYVRLWQEGVRPTYAAALTEPVKEEVAEKVEFSAVQR